MNRIDQTFKELKKNKKKAFISYITAGDPDIASTKKTVKALANAGADIIELGVPFSDPLADGPTIQRAIERSLKSGTSVKNVFKMVKELRKDVSVPFVFMTYYNIVYNYGVSSFIKDAKKSGVDGIIVPDLPMEESDEIIRIGDKEDFCIILLAAPTTPLDRFKKIAQASRGFIYYVSLTGVTGARKDLSKDIDKQVRKLKKLTKKPICIGFGVSNPLQAKTMAKVSDGVIVGSAIINVIEKSLSSKKRISGKVEMFAKPIASAIHSV